MEQLLSFAVELERRDADLAGALLGVERLQVEVEELRAHGSALAAFFAALPVAVAERDADERAAEEARGRAQAALPDAEKEVERARREDERLAAERALRDARDELHDAEAWAAKAYEARGQLDREAEMQQAEAERLVGRAAQLAARVRDLPPPGPGLEGAVEWGSRARGALLLEHSGLVGERDEVVREATELVASVLGEPLVATGVAGVRDRLERALHGA